MLFDIIESVGVLHHMQEPSIGWKILADHLRPGGMIKIGLYSSIAREEITKIRAEIAHLKLRPDVKSMKDFRKKIIDREKDNVRFVQDFYSLSMFRDLLFHAQEHLLVVGGFSYSLKVRYAEIYFFRRQQMHLKRRPVVCEV